MPVPLSKVIYRLSIYFQFMLCQANNHQKKKLKRSILLECIQNVFLCLSSVIVPVLTRKKNCLFCPTCFCPLLDCFSGSVIFFNLEKFHNTKLKISMKRFNQIVRSSQPHLLYSPLWVPLYMDLDPLQTLLSVSQLLEFNTIIHN